MTLSRNLSVSRKLEKPFFSILHDNGKKADNLFQNAYEVYAEIITYCSICTDFRSNGKLNHENWK